MTEVEIKYKLNKILKRREKKKGKLIRRELKRVRRIRKLFR